MTAPCAVNPHYVDGMLVFKSNAVCLPVVSHLLTLIQARVLHSRASNELIDLVTLNEQFASSWCRNRNVPSNDRSDARAKHRKSLPPLLDR